MVVLCSLGPRLALAKTPVAWLRHCRRTPSDIIITPYVLPLVTPPWAHTVAVLLLVAGRRDCVRVLSSRGHCRVGVDHGRADEQTRDANICGAHAADAVVAGPCPAVRPVDSTRPPHDGRLEQGLADGRNKARRTDPWMGMDLDHMSTLT